MRVVPFLLMATCVAAAPAAVNAQDEELREIDALTAEISERLSDDDSQDLRQALKLLKQARRVHVSARRLERLMEAAESSDDEERLERLRMQQEELELTGEGIFAALELLEGKLEVTGLLEELEEEELTELAEEAQELLELQQQRIDLVLQLFEFIRDDEEERIEEAEEELESLEEVFVHRSSVLELQLELYWAEEEEDEEAIEELRVELQQLKDGDEADDEEHGEDEDDDWPEESRSSSDLAGETGPLLQPIEVTSDDVTKAAALRMETDILPLLQRHCFDCHDDSSASGDLNLQQLTAQQPLVLHRTHWLNVRQQLKIRSMPPQEAVAPSDDDRRILVAWLTHQLDHFDYSTVRQPGYETARRLTHDEYNNTIRDLFGFDLRPADRFPVDLKATSGFDNSANSLFIQPVLMERYLGAAEFVVQQTLGDQATAAQRQQAERKILAGRSAQDALMEFAAGAWRRPLETEEREQLQQHFRQLAGNGRSPRAALLDALQLVLVSPKFLIRSEQAPQPSAGAFQITDYELASRLSYFLWASMPDEPLLQLAADGTLHEPRVLAGQVERMLDDQRARTLGTIFAAQWLGFSGLDRIQPDQIDNPWATDSLIQAMQDESAMFFSELVRTNASIETLVDGDFTYLNEELAKHYGMRGVRGEDMRRVSLLNSPRGGVLGHGSILAITSFPGRTSPVVRGNWILTELLGTPPPPPPPNVSQFDEQLEDRESLSQREKMRLHRRNPACYVCHNQIDPLGFALEEFEWFGRYQPRYRGRSVDARGELPDGTVVEGLAGLRQALVTQRRDDLVEQLTRKMLSYALGRQLEYYDEATVREIIADAESNDRHLRSVIHAIVRSDAFQKKQLPEN